MPSAPKPRELHVRNKGLVKVRVGDLVEQEWNPARHPDSQAELLAAAVDEIGWVGYPAVFVMLDGRYGLADGHLRKSVLVQRYGADAEIEVNVTDLDEATAKQFAATGDPIAKLREADAAKMQELLTELESFASQPLNELMTQLANQNMPAETEPEQAADKLTEQSETLEAFIAARKKSTERGNDKAETNFWVCLVFQSWEQKQEFLFAIKDIPVLYGMYADGQTLAQRLGIRVTPNAQREITSPLDKKLMALVEPSLVSQT